MRVYAPVGGWLGGDGKGVVVFDDRRSEGESCWHGSMVVLGGGEREDLIVLGGK